MTLVEKVKKLFTKKPARYCDLYFEGNEAVITRGVVGKEESIERIPITEEDKHKKWVIDGEIFIFH